MIRENGNGQSQAGKKIIMIRPVQNSDIEQLCGIYNFYVGNTTVTFEEVPVYTEEMRNRVRETSSAFPWLVWEETGRILGYAYAAKWKERSAYRYSVESTVYVRNDSRGIGVGSGLYSRLIEETRKIGIHTVIAVIALPNEESRRLHEKLGFEKVAHFAEVGFKFGGWVDVGCWQLTLKEKTGHNHETMV